MFPLETWVSSPVGTVTGAQCCVLFRNDDPATYLRSGASVGPASHSQGWFRKVAQGLGQGTFEYQQDSGHMVWSFVSADKNFEPERNDDGTIASSSSAFVGLKVITAGDYFSNGGRSVQRVSHTGSAASSCCGSSRLTK